MGAQNQTSVQGILLTVMLQRGGQSHGSTESDSGTGNLTHSNVDGGTECPASCTAGFSLEQENIVS